MPHGFLSRRSFLTLASSTAAGWALPGWGQTELKRARVVVILADDLGYGDLGCYGAPDIRTPHLDQLARQGVRLTDYYAAAPVCTPTRCALFTGRYPQRVPNLEWAIHPGVKTVGLPSRDTTVATMLKDAGYRTALFGKWHLGYNEPNRPTRHGFEEFFGPLSGNVDYFRHIESNEEPDLYENEEPVRAEGYLTDLITDRAVDYIRRRAQEPFFLTVAYNAPHWPIQGPEDGGKDIGLKDWGKQGERSTYARMVERMDEGIGRILEELKAQGLEEDTFVVFCSDNGGDRLGRNDPLSGRKTHLNEGGIRVPCILRWPRIIPAGTVTGQAAITMDLTTLLLAAANVRPTRHQDGFNIFPFVCGEKPPIERTFLWRNGLHGEKAVRWGHWKWIQKGEEDFLYYLPEDIAEQKNLASRYSDIVHGVKSIYWLWEKAMPHKQTLFGDELKNLDPPTY